MAIEIAVGTRRCADCDLLPVGDRPDRPDRDQAAEEPLHAGAGRPDRPRGCGRDPSAVPDHQGRAHHQVPHQARRSAGGCSPSGTEQAGLRVLVHAGEPEGDQRVRAPGRADVRAAGHVHRGRDRRRGGWRDGPRAVARPAAPRNGECVEGAESVAAARADSPGNWAVPWSEGARERPSPRARSSGSARCSSDTAAISRSRPTCSARRSWRARATTLARWRSMFETIASGVEEQRRRRAAVDEQPSGSRQPHALHHPGSRSADHCPRGRRSRLRDRSRRRLQSLPAPLTMAELAKRKTEPVGQHRSIRRHSRPARAPPVGGIPEHQRRQGLPGRRARRTGQPCRPATP